MTKPLKITKAQRAMLREHLGNLVRYETEEARCLRRAFMGDAARESIANAEAFRLALRAVLALPVEGEK